MFPEVDSVLIDRARLEARVAEMAAELAADIERDLVADGHTTMTEGQVVLVPILAGSLIFAADLIRQLPLKLSLGLVGVSSYPGATTESKGAHLASELPNDLAGKHVVIIDDILDSGRTMAMVREQVLVQSPASVRSAVLLDKPARRAVDIKADYVGFEIPDAFVVGYGLDYDGYYRNHPEIVILKPDAIGGEGSM